MDLTWSAAETTGDVAEDDTGKLPVPPPEDPEFPLPDPPLPPEVDSLSEPPPEYGPEPANSPKFSVVATVLGHSGEKCKFSQGLTSTYFLWGQKLLESRSTLVRYITKCIKLGKKQRSKSTGHQRPPRCRVKHKLKKNQVLCTKLAALPLKGLLLSATGFGPAPLRQASSRHLRRRDLAVARVAKNRRRYGGSCLPADFAASWLWRQWRPFAGRKERLWCAKTARAAKGEKLRP